MKKLIYLTATLACISLPSLSFAFFMSDESKIIPTLSEVREVMKKYSETFDFPMSRMHVFYENPNLPDKGAIAAVKLKKRKECGIIINPSSRFRGHAADFIEGAPSLEAGKSFAIAHEMSHCQFSYDQSNQIMASLNIAITNQSHGQEILADMMATRFLIHLGTDFDQIIEWLNKERKGHFFSPHYNTAEHISLDSIQKLSELLIQKESEQVQSVSLN